MTAMTDIKKAPVKSRIVSRAEVQSAIQTVIAKQQLYRAVLDEYKVALDPAGAAHAARQLIDQAKDPGEIFKAQQTLAAFEGEAGRIAYQNARRVAEAAFLDFKHSIPQLLDAADKALAEVQAEADADESHLFDLYGLPREATGVTRRLNDVRQTLSEFRAAINPPIHEKQPFRPVPGALSQIPAFFS